MADNTKEIVIKFSFDGSAVITGVKNIADSMDTAAKKATEANKAENKTYEELLVRQRELQKAIADRTEQYAKLETTLARIAVAPKLNNVLATNAADTAVDSFNRKIGATTLEVRRTTSAFYEQIGVVNQLGRTYATLALGMTSPTRNIDPNTNRPVPAQQASARYTPAIAPLAYTPTFSGLTGPTLPRIAEEQRRTEEAAAATHEQAMFRLVERRLAQTNAAEEASVERQVQLHNMRTERIARENSISTSRYQNDLNNQDAEMRSSIEHQIAAARYGANSIQVHRVEAAEAARQAELRYQHTLEGIRSRVGSGTIGSSQGLTESALAQTHYANAIATSTQVLNEQEAAHQQSIRTYHNLAFRAIELIGIYRVYNAIINTVSNSIKAVPQIGIQLEATKAVLTSTTGSSAGAGSYMAGLEAEAKRTGITIDVLRQSFRQLQASTSLAGESGQTTWAIFTQLNSVMTSLHSSTAEAQGVFNAISQIFNKSKVQSEELVKQLGNLLPGAYAAFAAANKMTTQELTAELRKGDVYAHERVLNFTKFYEERFAGSFAIASQGINANIGRMQSSFTLLGEAIYKLSSGSLISVTQTFTQYAEAVTKSVNENGSLIQGIRMVAEVLTAVLGVALVQAVIKSDRLKGAMGFLASPNAIITGITAIVLHLRDIGAEQEAIYEDAIRRQKAFEHRTKFEDKAQPITIRAENAADVVEIKDIIAKEKKELNRVQGLIFGAKQRGAKPTSVTTSSDFFGGMKSAPEAADILTKNIAKDQEILASALQKNITMMTAAQNEETRIAKEADEARNQDSIKGLTQKLAKQQAMIDADRTNADTKAKEEAALGTLSLQGDIAKAERQQQSADKLQRLAPDIYASKIVDLQTRIEQMKVNEIKLEQQHLAIAEQRTAQLKQQLNLSVANREDLLKGIKFAESRGSTDKHLLGPVTKSGQAEGLYQIMPATKAGIEKQTGKKLNSFDETDAHFMANYLMSQYMKMFEGDIPKAIAAYNFNPAGVASLVKRFGDSWMEHAPKETQKYIPLVMSKVTPTNLDVRETSYDTDRAKLQGQSSLVQMQFAQSKAKIDEEGANKVLAFNKEIEDTIDSIHQKYLINNGTINEEIFALDKAYKAQEEMLTIAEKNNNISAQKAANARDELKSTNITELLHKQISVLSQKDQESAAKYNEATTAINTKVEAGVMSRKQALLEENDIRKIRIAEENKIIEALEAHLSITTKIKDREKIQTEIAKVKTERTGTYGINGATIAGVGAGPSDWIALQEELTKNKQDVLGRQNQYINTEAKPRDAALQKKQNEVKMSVMQGTPMGDINTKQDAIDKQRISNAQDTQDNLNKISEDGRSKDLIAHGKFAVGQMQVMEGAAANYEQIMINMYGAGSKAAKEAFIIHKAISLATAIVSTAVAVTEALRVAPPVGFVLAGIAAAAGAMQIAVIAATPMPAAHGGLDYVPAEQTYLLDKGERVLSPNQNKDLTNFVRNNTMQQSNAQPAASSNVRIINSIDPSITHEHMGSEAGQQIIMNTIKRNAA